MNLLPVFKYLQELGPSVLVRNSAWLFPTLECIHLLVLISLVGSVAIVSFRLLDVGLTRVSISDTSDILRPLRTVSLLVLLATGTLLYNAEAVACLYSSAFWTKITFLSLAIICQYTLTAWVTGHGRKVGRMPRYAVAILSLGLWLVVVTAGGGANHRCDTFGSASGAVQAPTPSILDEFH